MANSLADSAIEILRLTNDGDDLDPTHLKLLELAVNGRLTEIGKSAFADLLAQVRAGYAKPWLHGVEHITRDHDGYVYWKSHRIEHFSSPYAHSDQAKIYVVQLAARCAALEQQGVTPSFSSITALASG